MTTLRCTALILGSGPAGLFAADALLRAGVTDIVIAERGRPMTRRLCPPGPGCECRTCPVLEGEGGAGSFSDGKITLSAVRGTHSQRLFTDTQAEQLDTIAAAVRRNVNDAVDYAPVPELAALAGHENRLRGESYPLLHVGSDGIREFGRRFSTELQDRGVRLLTGVDVTKLRIINGQVIGVVARDRSGPLTIDATAVVAAVGMVGTPWLEQQLTAVGVTLETGPADIGIRLETSAAALDPLIGQFYDFKAHHTSPGGIDVRSFCVNGHGYIVNEFHRPLDIRGVNGHSFLHRRSDLSNLAILATITEASTPDPKAYVRDTARAITASTGGYPVRQPLAGFLPDAATGQPLGVAASNPKTRAGDLRAALPPRLAEAFASYITALGAALPPVLAPDTVLYAPEIKYYNYRVPIDPTTWQSRDIAGLYVVGNAAGYTASLSAAALSGLIAGQAIADQAQVASLR
ncbi:NAD(P)/FAD-dependent oxidoreductase [Micromonospora sp. NPDC049282]|uniref:NAD(P)/FAD-dependent oxidoreductase n=1 Tax=Micromonospora sp. NPDC049282 TaxID=3364269 RepID=UPI0037240086